MQSLRHSLITEHWDIRKMKTAKKEMKRGPEILGLRCNRMGRWEKGSKVWWKKGKAAKSKKWDIQKPNWWNWQDSHSHSNKLPASFVMERKPLPLLSCQQISVMFEENLHRNWSDSGGLLTFIIISLNCPLGNNCVSKPERRYMSLKDFAHCAQYKYVSSK